MRSALVWLVGASLAFFATAGAFLVLANFGTAPRASDPIPQPEPSAETGSPGPDLVLNFSEERLKELERRQNQTLTLYLENRGEEELESVDLELVISSEDTAHPRVRRYEETIVGLAPGALETVDLRVDLSPPPPVESLAVLGEGHGGDREILEARAYPPGGEVVIETAILSP